MTVNCLQITEKLQLKPFPPEKAAEACRRGETKLWLDIEDLTAGEIETWLERFSVSELSKRLCREGHSRSGFYPLQTEIFLVMPFYAEEAASTEVAYVTFICIENMLVTLHDRSVMNLQNSFVLHESTAWLPDRSIAGLVSAVMIGISLTSLKRTADLRNEIAALEKRMEFTPDTVEAAEIMGKRSELLTAGAMISDQLPILNALSVTDKPFFKLKDATEYLHCALVNLQSVDGTLTWLDERINALNTAFQMNAQDKTNHRLNRLTVLSAIFMPITLLAGIWGMNFEIMPELKFILGYPIALGAMALIGVGMFFSFRKDGWFD